MTAHAPYWPLATLLAGMLLGGIASSVGIETMWQCELDPKATAVRSHERYAALLAARTELDQETAR